MSPCIDHHALLVEYIIVSENLLTSIKVKTFYSGLGTLEGIGEHPHFNRLILRYTKGAHQVLHSLPAKDPHEVARVVFEGGQYGGELAESAYLQRVFETYGQLQPGLPHWAQRLYGELLAHCELLPEGLP